ncbi:MAG: hypothetical protein RSF40_01440 [Oscillospiraceae bacterium]
MARLIEFGSTICRKYDCENYSCIYNDCDRYVEDAVVKDLENTSDCPLSEINQYKGIGTIVECIKHKEFYQKCRELMVLESLKELE